MKYFIKIILICFLITSCASIIKVPDLCDIEYTKLKFKDVTLSDLNAGYKLYIRKCGGCHALYSPTYHSNEEWEKTLPEMIEKSKINISEEIQIRKYIFSMNRNFSN